MSCSECGGTTIWDDSAASEICTDCGTLTDPNQLVLTTHTYLNDYQSQSTELWDPSAPATLKNPRTSWALAGQGQEARDRKNSYAIAAFIKSLAVSLNAPGLAPRATTLFTHAKAIEYVRWGRRARLVAGACLVVALRESSRPDSIHDIAVLLKISPNLLARTFVSLTSALNITTNSVGPSVFIGTLQTYLASALDEPLDAGATLPTALRRSLQTLSLHSVANTASSLCNLIARLCPLRDATKTKPSAASMACAIFMLSLEAEARATLTSLGDLAKALGARLQIGNGVVMAQYKAIQDQVQSLVEQVPWLKKYEASSKGKGRAKVAKRTIVARGLKDVIAFNEEILRNTLLPDVSFDEPSLSDEDEGAPVNEGRECPATPAINSDNDERPSKRRKLHHSLDEATRFLLNPLSRTAAKSKTKAVRPSSTFPLTTYVLSTSSVSEISHNPPSRLQLLSTERGGSDESAIRDDELFTEGELEGLLRSEQEIEVMAQVLGWDEDASNSEEEASMKERSASSVLTGRKRGREGAVSSDQLIEPSKKPRINMEALSCFMQGSSSNSDTRDHPPNNGESFEDANIGLMLGLDDAFDGDDFENIYGLSFSSNKFQEHEEMIEDGDALEFPYYEGAGDLDTPITTATHSTTTSTYADDGEEEIIIDGWRPASPSGHGCGFDEYFEEEYD